MPETQPETLNGSNVSKKKTMRNVTFTKFGAEPDWSQCKQLVRYIAYSQETTPTTGRLHWQGYAQSWKPMRLSGWVKMLYGAHIDEMRGNFRENEAYCSKEGKLVEHGEKPNHNGVQTTMLEYKRRLDDGATTMECAEDRDLFPQYVRSHRAFEKYENYIRGKRMKLMEFVPEVYIRWGAAGTGKTHGVFKLYGRDKVCIVPDNTGKWFDNCHNSDVMLFDDVEIDAVPPISQFLRLTDRYPMQVPVKGGFIWWKPKVIVFTSNLPWEQWWKSLNTEHKRAVQRRLTRVTRIYKDHEIVEYENADHELFSQTQGGDPGPSRSVQEVTEQSVHEAQVDDQTSSDSDEPSQ